MPLWSGIAADRDSFQGHRSGNFNPLLYLLYNVAPGHYFHDITGIGAEQRAATNNGLFPTRPGYDEATGIGTPIMSALITQSPDRQHGALTGPSRPRAVCCPGPMAAAALPLTRYSGHDDSFLRFIGPSASRGSRTVPAARRVEWRRVRVREGSVRERGSAAEILAAAGPVS